MNLSSSSFLDALILFLTCLLCITVFSHFRLTVPDVVALHQLERRGSVVYYSIVGSSVGSLRKEMRQLGPKDENGQSCYAYTTWKLNWSWPKDDAGKIDLKNAAVKLAISLSLPRWSNYSISSIKMRGRWDVFFVALLQHEYGHMNMAKRTAVQLQKELRTSHSISEAHLKARSAVSRLARMGKEYDRRTLGGLTQGVLLR